MAINFISLFIIFATSNLMGNAFPATSFQQWASMQQSSTLDKITEALNVSCKKGCYHSMYCIIIIILGQMLIGNIGWSEWDH